MGEGHGHSHVPKGKGAEEKLRIALLLTGGYMIAEAAGGFLTGSLALLSDAAHMLSDVAALAVALAAIQIGKRPADEKRTFGYYRFEILAAAVNAIMLFLIGAFILFEAYERFFRPQEVASGWMLGIAAVGFAANLVSVRMLQGSQEESLNVKGAYLEVYSDLLGSIGVIVAALLIRLTGQPRIDPILAVLIGLWVLPRAWTLLNESVNILLEGAPEGIRLAEINDALRAIPGVREVHDLHVWAITSGRNSLTAHLVVEPGAQGEGESLRAASEMLEHRFGISHSTIQVERVSCSPNGDCHAF
jgi:cobalt-zinc-cadmium efflux system protein